MGAESLESTGTGTWIADTNRFNMEKPPDWWLRRIQDYDPYLCLIPSRYQRQYLMTRRRQFSGGLGDVALLDNKHPDTNMCMVHGLLPIAPLRWREGAQLWTEQSLVSLLDDLKARDLWANGRLEDPQTIIDRIEANEAAQEAKDRKDLRDKFYHMARDAYRSMKARIGSRNKRASDYHGVAKPTGTGLIVP